MQDDVVVLMTQPVCGGGAFRTDFLGSEAEAHKRAAELAKEYGYQGVTWKNARRGYTESDGPGGDYASFDIMSGAEYDKFMGG